MSAPRPVRSRWKACFRWTEANRLARSDVSRQCRIISPRIRAMLSRDQIGASAKDAHSMARRASQPFRQAFQAYFLILARTAWFAVGTLGLMMPIVIAATMAAMKGMRLRIIARLPPHSGATRSGLSHQMPSAQRRFYALRSGGRGLKSAITAARNGPTLIQRPPRRIERASFISASHGVAPIG